jgi:hypothetical protein
MSGESGQSPAVGWARAGVWVAIAALMLFGVHGPVKVFLLGVVLTLEVQHVAAIARQTRDSTERDPRGGA